MLATRVSKKDSARMSPDMHKTRAILNLMLKQVRNEAVKFSNGKKPRRWFDPAHGICDNTVYKLDHAATGDDRADKAVDLLEDLGEIYASRAGAPHGTTRVCPVQGFKAYLADRAAGVLWENPERFRYLDWLIEMTELE